MMGGAIGGSGRGMFGGFDVEEEPCSLGDLVNLAKHKQTSVAPALEEWKHCLLTSVLEDPVAALHEALRAAKVSHRLSVW